MGALAAYGGVGSLIQSYAKAALALEPNTKVRSPLDRELADLFALGLAFAHAGIVVADEFLPTLARDETYAVRLQGLERMKRGMATAFNGALVALGERVFYGGAARLHLAEQLALHLPACFPALSPKAQEGIKIRLRHVIETETDSKIAATLQELGQVLPKPPEQVPEPSQDGD
jgi:hypothetical protein